MTTTNKVMALAFEYASSVMVGGWPDDINLQAPLKEAVDTLVAERDALRAALSAPPGYVMVPVEPTPEMVTAMIAAMNVWIKDIGEDADIYAAMIAAAPKEGS